MNYRTLLAPFLSLIVIAGGASAAENKVIALVNASGLPAEEVAPIREFCEKNLFTTVALRGEKTQKVRTLAEAEGVATKLKKDGDVVTVVLLRSGPKDTEHLHIFRESNTAAINVSILASEDPDIFRKRLIRQVMRSAAFLIGLEQAPDPYCVTHPYRTLPQLDALGLELHPPYRALIRTKAKAEGLDVHPMPVPTAPVK